MRFLQTKEGNYINVEKMEKIVVDRDHCKYPPGHEQDKMRWKVRAVTSDNFSYLLGEFADEENARSFLEYTVDYSTKKLT